MSLYNNCSHQKWHLVITQYIEDYNECHSGGLSPGPGGSKKQNSVLFNVGNKTPPIQDLGSSCDAASQNPIGSAWPESRKL